LMVSINLSCWKLSASFSSGVTITVSLEYKSEESGLIFLLILNIIKRHTVEKVLIKKNEEKTVLLLEITDRVKNNLISMASLTNLQAGMLKDDKDAIKAFRSTSNRITSMARVHEYLYNSEDFTCINIEKYIYNFFDELKINHHRSDIRIQADVKDVCIDINQAIPIGLILYETVNNAIIHAFPSGKEGAIFIDIFRDGRYVSMKIRDNGTGMDQDFNKRKHLGLMLVESFVNQLEGAMQIRSDHGTIIEIKFPV